MGADSQYPSDYVQQDSSDLVKDEAKVEVDNVFENCHEYTESQGYECVPYYQCHNGNSHSQTVNINSLRVLQANHRLRPLHSRGLCWGRLQRHLREGEQLLQRL